MTLIVEKQTVEPNQVVGVLTKAIYCVNGYYRAPWADIVRGQRDANLLHLWYKIDDIQEEIDLLTSQVGKHRSSEEADHLLDLIRMSKDETELFNKWVKKVMAEVFTELSTYTPSNKKSYFYNEGTNTIQFDSSSIYAKIFKEGDWLIDTHTDKLYLAMADGDTSEMHKLEEHDATSDFRRSVHYIISYEPYLNYNQIEPLDTAILDALVNGIIYRWMKVAYPDEAQTWMENYQEELNNIRDRVHVFQSKIGYTRVRPF